MKLAGLAIHVECDFYLKKVRRLIVRRLAAIDSIRFRFLCFARQRPGRLNASIFFWKSGKPPTFATG
jgi:hypothetical protein